MVKGPHPGQYHMCGTGKFRSRTGNARLDVQLLVDICKRKNVAKAVVDENDHRIITFWAWSG
jgi:hypothetical protein